MISICIPIYNFDVRPLVEELSRQSKSLEASCEIILIDDNSEEKIKAINGPVCEKENYTELPQNVGRSKIRNLFLKHAQHPYLLFLDCDSIVENEHFLKNYIDILSNQPKVVCGGRKYPSQKPDKNHLLRWKYGIQIESQPVEVRKASPNTSFMTNNFLIQSAVFKTIQFDERLTQYGHEDTLFGWALKQEGISVTHIDNPIINGEIETNKEYLEKTEKGIDNLVQIIKFRDDSDQLIQEIKLLQFHQKIKKVEGLVQVTFFLFGPLVKFLLTKGWVSLRCFNFYKLGWYIKRRKVIN